MDVKKRLWLDDFRNPADYPEEGYDTVWVKNYKEFCSFINENGLPDKVCFDHDLGQKKSGCDCAKFLVDYCMKKKCDIPEYSIQSSNPCGKDNIIGHMETWHRFYMNNYCVEQSNDSDKGE